MSYRAACVPVMLLLLGGCLNQDLVYLTIGLDGTILSSEDAPVFVEFHHAEQGEGDLAHPLGWIDEISLEAPRPFTHQLNYPLHGGSGLFVYAWQDLDGDGLLCSPGGPSEPSGGSELIGSLSLQIQVEVSLSTACLGPERLIFNGTLNPPDNGST